MTINFASLYKLAWSLVLVVPFMLSFAVAETALLDINGEHINLNSQHGNTLWYYDNINQFI